MPRLVVAFSFTALLLASMACAPVGGSDAPADPVPVPLRTEGAVPDWATEVAPVLERRCVVCHGCYDAPCQLQLSSWEGLERGGTHAAVYASQRLSEAPLTRLFQDARSRAEWREKGFHPVVAEEPGEAHLLLGLLALGRANPPAPGERLPESIPLDINRGLECPAPAALEGYVRDHPEWGMPYGTAPLTADELDVLARYVGQGAPPPGSPAPLARAALAQVADWEAFLNRETVREQLVARYLYEHWYIAHLYFDDLPSGPFFRIVRSSTPPGSPIVPIATRRPYDDPGTEPFWYRLSPVRDTILHKTHIVYPLGAAKMKRLHQLFLDPAWEVTELPTWNAPDTANPFRTFREIPPRARYQFLLDDAQHFIMTFIRGPVCRGQVATNVIRDRFWVSFLDPDVDLSVVDPSFMERAQSLLSLPAEVGSDLSRLDVWTRYGEQLEDYRSLREEYYDAADPDEQGPGLEFIWDGDGHDRDALLTVFRHFDNATVVKGFVGTVPETAWVIDYPLLERIYYDLVAGFDVFGNVTHQIATRLYMDHLRMEGEELFVRFLPEESRGPVIRSWYRDADSQLDAYLERASWHQHGTRVEFESDDPKAELLLRIESRSSAVAGPPDRLNRCSQASCVRPGASPLERAAEAALARLPGRQGPWVAPLPEVTFVRVHAAGGEAAVYTLLVDREHANVAFMFGESKRLLPERDEVTVARGTLGSYPNFVFDVPVESVEAFVDALLASAGPEGLHELAAAWGVRRTATDFWETADWLADDFQRRAPTQAGLFDLGRYRNY